MVHTAWTGTWYRWVLRNTLHVYAENLYLLTSDILMYRQFLHLTPCFIAGARHGRRATWIGASGDQTYLRIDESLINAHTLSKSNIFANNSCIGKF